MSPTKTKPRAGNGGSKPRRHRDAKHLEALAEHFDGRDVDLAKALKVKPQVLNNWKRRGIAPAMRGTVFKLMQAHRCAPPLDWLTG